MLFGTVGFLSPGDPREGVEGINSNHLIGLDTEQSDVRRLTLMSRELWKRLVMTPIAGFGAPTPAIYEATVSAPHVFAEESRTSVFGGFVLNLLEPARVRR